MTSFIRPSCALAMPGPAYNLPGKNIEHKGAWSVTGHKGLEAAMDDFVAVACPQCGWLGKRRRSDLEHDKVVACPRCYSLFSAESAEQAGRRCEPESPQTASSS